MHRIFLLCAIATAIGCGRSDPTEHGSRSDPRPTNPGEPNRTPRVNTAKAREYRTKIAPYLEECFAATKFFKELPSSAKVKEKVDSLAELQSRLPAVPPELDEGGELTSLLQELDKGLHNVALIREKADNVQGISRDELMKLFESFSIEAARSHARALQIRDKLRE